MNTTGIGAPTFRAMTTNLKRIPLLVLGACVMLSVSVENDMAQWLTLGLGVSGAIALASVYGLIYIQFRKKSVKALIWVQGLQVTCMLLVLLLLSYISVSEVPFYSKVPVYFLTSYPLLAILAALYGRRYAFKRWRPRAEWLGEYSRLHETVPSSVLYASFFANPSLFSKQKMVYWLGALAPTTLFIEQTYGNNVLVIPTSVLATWAGFAVISNLVIRSRLVRTFLGKRDLQWVE